MFLFFSTQTPDGTLAASWHPPSYCTEQMGQEYTCSLIQHSLWHSFAAPLHRGSLCLCNKLLVIGFTLKWKSGHWNNLEKELHPAAQEQIVRFRVSPKTPSLLPEALCFCYWLLPEPLQLCDTPPLPQSHDFGVVSLSRYWPLYLQYTASLTWQGSLGFMDRGPNWLCEDGGFHIGCHYSTQHICCNVHPHSGIGKALIRKTGKIKILIIW